METIKYLWQDRARKFGRTHILKIPMSFKKYKLSDEELFFNLGFINTVEDQILLYKITDVTVTCNLFDRLFNTGTITVESSDKSLPVIVLEHVSDVEEVRNLINKCVASARKTNKVNTYENQARPIEDEEEIQ